MFRTARCPSTKVSHDRTENWSSAHQKRQIPSETRSEERKQSGGCNLQPPFKRSKYSRNKQLIFQGCHAQLVEWICTAQIRLKQGRRETHFFQRKFGQTRKKACGACTAGIRCQLFSSESSSSEDIFKIPASSQPDIVSRSASFRF